VLFSALSGRFSGPAHLPQLSIFRPPSPPHLQFDAFSDPLMSLQSSSGSKSVHDSSVGQFLLSCPIVRYHTDALAVLSHSSPACVPIRDHLFLGCPFPCPWHPSLIDSTASVPSTLPHTWFGVCVSRRDLWPPALSMVGRSPNLPPLFALAQLAALFLSFALEGVDEVPKRIEPSDVFRPFLWPLSHSG